MITFSQPCKATALLLIVPEQTHNIMERIAQKSEMLRKSALIGNLRNLDILVFAGIPYGSADYDGHEILHIESLGPQVELFALKTVASQVRFTSERFHEATELVSTFRIARDNFLVDQALEAVQRLFPRFQAWRAEDGHEAQRHALEDGLGWLHKSQVYSE